MYQSGSYLLIGQDVRLELCYVSPDGIHSVTNWDYVARLFNGDIEECLCRCIERIEYDMRKSIGSAAQNRFQLRFKGVEFAENGKWHILCDFEGSAAQYQAIHTYLTGRPGFAFKKITLHFQLIID